MTIEHQSLLAPVVFFDLFEYPLTSTEIWKYQWAPTRVMGLEAVRDALDVLVERKVIACGNGFYFLPERDNLIQQRNRRHVVAYRKWRKVLRVIRLFRFFPFIRMIAVTNTLAYDNAADESDIDLFVVTKPGRIWTVRFWVLTFLKVFHLRPKPGAERDKICCAFFVDDDHVNLHDVGLHGEAGMPDVYLCYWFSTLWPVMNRQATYENLFEQNAWVRQYLPNSAPIIPNDMRRVDSVRWVQRCVEWVTHIIPERAYHRLQEMQFPESIRQLRGHDTRVVVSDTMLKFHTTDRREEYRNKFIEQMKRYDTSN